MIDKLNELDTSLFLYLNSLNSEYIDPIMIAISYSQILILILIGSLMTYGYFIYKKWIFLAFFICLISFGFSDRISSGFFKPTFERLRPCHNPTLANQVHLAGKKCWGGKFGFISSHASNSFTIAMFFFMLFRRKSKWFYLLFIYAFSVSYSRIYLAKHYPGDILVGAILGLICGYFGYRSFIFLKQRLQDQR